MSGLVIPTHVAARINAGLADTTAPAPGLIQSNIDVEHPWLGEDVPTELMTKLQSLRAVHRFNLLVKRIDIKRKVGGILLPDQVVADLQWMQGLGVVCVSGPSVYKGNKFDDVGLTQDDAPKVGDAIWFNARVPLKVKIDGSEYVAIPDDAILMTIPREELARFSFNF